MKTQSETDTAVVDATAPSQRLRASGQLQNYIISQIQPDPRNPRKHSASQIKAIARSIEAFGFNAPILIDRHRRIVAGHGRFEAAKLVGLDSVPVVRLDHLSDAQASAYMLADNKLTDRSSWDDDKLALQIKALSDLSIDFDLEATGFELPELDLRLQSLDDLDEAAERENFALASSAISRPGDLWLLGDHRLLCGSSLEKVSYETLLDGAEAAAVFTDPPYNVKIDGHVCGSGAAKHREFAMAAGEMTVAQFADFLRTFLDAARAHLVEGAVAYVCMDWKHMGELMSAAAASGFDLLNLCVWVKTNGGMGSLYRSRHELIFVLRNGGKQHVNNVQLGRFGRNRTNVWHYEGTNSFTSRGKGNDRELHPTLKPIGLVADALLDVTKRGDVVLDPFMGSGTTILAAERTGRRGYGIEIDPLYVDTVIRRWEKRTGRQARHASGATLAEITATRELRA